MTASVQNPAIAQAYGILKTLSADEETRLLAESREKGRRDIQSSISDARREGLREGLQEGRLEVARAALVDGLPVETVAKFTGLTVAEIKELRTS